MGHIGHTVGERAQLTHVQNPSGPSRRNKTRFEIHKFTKKSGISLEYFPAHWKESPTDRYRGLCRRIGKEQEIWRQFQSSLFFYLAWINLSRKLAERYHSKSTPKVGYWAQKVVWNGSQCKYHSCILTALICVWIKMRCIKTEKASPKISLWTLRVKKSSESPQGINTKEVMKNPVNMTTLTKGKSCKSGNYSKRMIKLSSKRRWPKKCIISRRKCTYG